MYTMRTIVLLLLAGASQKQKFTGTYSVNADGSGAISFVPPAGLLTSNALLAPGGSLGFRPHAAGGLGFRA